MKKSRRHLKDETSNITAGTGDARSQYPEPVRDSYLVITYPAETYENEDSEWQSSAKGRGTVHKPYDENDIPF